MLFRSEPGGANTTPGGPFVPSEGWESFIEGHPGVSNPDPVYPSADVNAKGGIIGGDVGDDKKHRTLLYLAQTGDAAHGALLVVAACVAGCVAVIALARSRRQSRRRA